jgi:hypothetical protein
MLCSFLPRSPAYLALSLIGALVTPARSQFVDRTIDSGLLWYRTSWGAAMVDLDRDGDLDLYAGHHFFEPTLFWNDGTGFFDMFLHDPPWTGLSDRHGVLALSLDSDDDPELFVTHGGGGGAGAEANELYQNDGDGVFFLLPGAAGMDDPVGRSRCASAADYDGDGSVDVWVGKAPDAVSMNSLFRNDGSFAFTDVASLVGLDEPHGTVGGIWGDYDDDGDPDLLVGGEEFTRPTILYRNDGGVFVDDTAIFASGLPVISGADWGDFDLDGDLDLALCDGQTGIFDAYAAGDTVTFFFNTRYGDTGIDGLTIPAGEEIVIAYLRIRGFMNPEKIFLGPFGVHPPVGSIIVLTDEYVGAPSFTPGEDQGIYVWRAQAGGPWELRCSTPYLNADNFDGWFTQIEPVPHVTEHDLEHPPFTSGAPRVWRNDGGSFVEVSSLLGLPAAMSNPRDISWVDYDNDGDLDLHVVDTGTSADPNGPDALFRNDGASFVDVTTLEGVAGSSEGMGDGGVWGDVDGDGDLDLYLLEGTGPLAFSLFGPSWLLANEGSRGHSIQIDLVGLASGPTALGSVATVVAGSKRIERHVTANSWRGFQDPVRLHFGIGPATLADSLIIEWTSGKVDVVTPFPEGIWTLSEEGIPTSGPSLSPRVTGSGWALSPLSPQPARSDQAVCLATDRPTRIEVTVHDVSGRRVRRLSEGTVPAGTTTLRWDGRNDAGHPVPGGVYFWRVTDGSRTLVRKGVRLR